jgi:hypothetical protein
VFYESCKDMEKFEQWWKGLVKELEDDIETIEPRVE